MHITSTPNQITLANTHISVTASVENGALTITLSALTPQGQQVPILSRTGTNHTTEPLAIELPDHPSLELTELSDSALLTIRGTLPSPYPDTPIPRHPDTTPTLSITLRLFENSPWLEVAELYSSESHDPATHPQLASLEAAWRFLDWQSPGEVFSPVLTPEKNDVIGRHVLRSPALCAQSQDRAAVLLNDPDQIARQQLLPAAMNLLRDPAKNNAPILITGLRPHQVRGHVFYESTPDSPQRPSHLHHAYQLFVATGVPAGTALEAATTRLWQRWGRRNHIAHSPPHTSTPMTYPDYAREIYPRALQRNWVETTLPDPARTRVGAITINRSYPRDVWMCPWFSQIRSAYGLYLWGQSLNLPDWTARALATRDLHLAAPQSRGLFPTVCILPEPAAPAPLRWVHSHHQGGGPNIYHLFDMSWTAYQLLRWHRDLLPHPPTLAFVRAYARGILNLQAPDGALPAYLNATSFTPITSVDTAALLADLRAFPGNDYLRWGVEKGWGRDRFLHSAEDSASLLLLAELARALPPDDPDRPAFLAAAAASAAWLEANIFPTARWTDFEVFHSCSAKPLDFYDHRSGQGPQNTLCMHTAAAGLLALYQLTQNPRHLALARRALARMSLYQQIWNPPFLNFHCIGGYGVMNTDGEWSDARQAQFADTHLDFHRVQNDPEQLQRAQAACRASFATLFHPANAPWYPTGWNRSPRAAAAENHAHGGFDSLNGVSSFDWGAGSALATAAYLQLHHAL